MLYGKDWASGLIRADVARTQIMADILQLIMFLW